MSSYRLPYKTVRGEHWLTHRTADTCEEKILKKSRWFHKDLHPRPCPQIVMGAHSWCRLHHLFSFNRYYSQLLHTSTTPLCHIQHSFSVISVMTCTHSLRCGRRIPTGKKNVQSGRYRKFKSTWKSLVPGGIQTLSSKNWKARKKPLSHS